MKRIGITLGVLVGAMLGLSGCGPTFEERTGEIQMRARGESDGCVNLLIILTLIETCLVVAQSYRMNIR